MTYEQIIKELESLANPKAVEGMARFGITPGHAYGVSLPEIRRIAKEAGRDRGLAKKLWSKDNRETRILASMIDKPELLTEDEMQGYISEFTDWEICDQFCMNLFEKSAFAYEKCFEWSAREREFEKRAGFVLMARLAVSDKKAEDKRFEAFLPVIIRESKDPRNFVKKAVNWALRQIGKRNLHLNAEAIEAAKQIQAQQMPAAGWVAADALRELQSEPVRSRLEKASKRSSSTSQDNKGIKRN